jgi:ribosome maturation factor RimP
MNREMLAPFQGAYVKLVLEGNFVLSGTIEMVYEDAILFTTTQKTALITFDRIKEVTPMNGGAS